MATQLSRAPNWTTIRTKAGAIAIDNATINLTNYPLDDRFDASGVDKMLLQWHADSGLTASDTIDVEVLVFNADYNNWVVCHKETGVGVQAGAVIPVFQASKVFIRIDAVSFTGAPTGLTMYGAKLTGQLNY